MGYNSYGLKSLLDKDKCYSVLDSFGVNGLNNPDPNGFRCSCPLHKSSSNTIFVFNPDTHLYCCYGGCLNEEKDGDIIKLVQLLQKCTYDSAIEYICEVSGIDIKLIENSTEWLLDELRNKMDVMLMDIVNNQDNIVSGEWEYGVQPLEEALAAPFIGKKDTQGFIDELGFKATTLTLFESGFDPKENRWLLTIRSEDGQLLGFDGRDITNKSASKWKKRKGLLTNKLLGRLDLVKSYILEQDEIIIVEGKKDQMALWEADLKWTSCTYGSALSENQAKIIGTLCSKIVIFPDGDQAGYKHVESTMAKCYPEFEILVCETPDDNDPADLTIRYVKELYDKKITAEEWLEKYKYRTKKKKK